MYVRNGINATDLHSALDQVEGNHSRVGEATAQNATEPTYGIVLGRAELATVFLCRTMTEINASHISEGKKKFNNVVRARTIGTCTTKLPFLACLVAGISERISLRKLPQVRHSQLQRVKCSS